MQCIHDAAQTPLERVLACAQAKPEKVAELIKLRQSLDPFQLGKLPRCAGERKNTTRRAKRLWVSGYISNVSTIEPRVTF